MAQTKGKTPQERAHHKYSYVDVIPFRLHNISDFVVESHPTQLHPELPEYNEYWMDQAEKCITGKWGHDYDHETGLGGWRWMPGNLYFYTNMGLIEREGEQNTAIEDRPLLRSVEWFIFYGLATCDGFSGFSDDEENCSFEPLKPLKDGEELGEALKYLLNEYGDLYRKPNGEYKNYVEAREYLYKTHARPLGSPLFHNEAKNFVCVTSRRIGKSYSMVDGTAVYDMTFNGSRSLDEWINKKTKSTIVLGSDDYKTTGEFLDKFDLCYNHLKKNIGSYDTGDPNTSTNGYFWTPLNEKGEGLGKVYKEKGGIVTNAKYGPGSKMVHVSYGKNPQAGVGYGAKRMIVEEAAKVPNFQKMHNENSATQKRTFKYGYSIYIATGGDIDKIKDLKDVFFNPSKYQCLAYPDLFSNHEKGIGLFLPCYYRNEKWYDKNGNLKIESAFKKEVEERESLRGAEGFFGHCISFPFKPSEMFVQNFGSKFPVEPIAERLMDLEDGEWQKIAKVGTLHYVDRENRKVIFEEDKYGRLKPILRYGDEKKMSDITGAFIQYEPPKSYKPDRYSRNPLYLAIYDTVAKDKEVSGANAGTSLSCVLVIKLNDLNDDLFSFNIVAEWFGRYDELDDNHKMAWKIADYYGCKLFPEINLDDILRFSKKIGRWNDLEDKPTDTPVEIGKGSTYSKGYMITTQAKPKLLEYAAQALEVVVGRTDFITGSEYYSEIQKVFHRMPSIRMCDEFLSYNDDENFDGISCFLLWGLYRRNKEAEPTSEYHQEQEDKSMDEFINLTKSGYVRNPAYDY